MTLLHAAGPIATSIGGSIATRRGRPWYRQLRKPAFTPPGWLFGPVWTGLYTSMIWSAWRVTARPHSAWRTRALALWWGQLALNAAWSPLFFGARKKRLALADLALLLPTVGAYIWAASKVDKPAAWMMSPYLGWSAFAAGLNEELVRLNR